MIDGIVNGRRTGEAEVCVLLGLQDVEEGVKEAIVFLCLQCVTNTREGRLV